MIESKKIIWRFDLHVPCEDKNAYLFASENMGASVCWGGHQQDNTNQFIIFLAIEDSSIDAPLKAQIYLQHQLDFFGLKGNVFNVNKVEHQDWVAATQHTFPPILVGPFFIFGEHYNQSIPHNKIAITLEAALAFGSGQHETTRGCLELLGDLSGLPVQKVLDLGCGSGILAIAAAKLLKADITAVDIDAFAVQETTKNISKNGVSDSIRVLHTDGIKEVKDKNFDLIIANILANPLKFLASSIVGHLKQGGLLILSGYLENQAQSLHHVYTNLGCKVLKQVIENNWVTSLLGYKTKDKH